MAAPKKQAMHQIEPQEVVMRFQDECADDNRLLLGPNGVYASITGKSGMVVVPKKEWTRFYDKTVRGLIKNRKLIVLSGLSETERALYNADYKEGEVLDEMAFAKLLDMGEELLDIFPKLCREHREMVARRFAQASVEKDPRALNRDLIVKLNRISKEDYASLTEKDPRKKGAFYPIIERLNQMDAE